jgi:hypothetical protein
VVGELTCIECGDQSDDEAHGWVALPCEEIELDEEPQVAFYCGTCASYEFGSNLSGQSRRVDEARPESDERL